MSLDKRCLLNAKGETEEEFLRNYDSERYKKPSVTVDTLIFTVTDEVIENNRKLPDKELRILLVKRKDHPYIGQWAIPGGFVGINESLDDAAKRELMEETNVDSVYLEQLYTIGEVNRDPRMRVISVAYMALVDEKNLKPKAGDDAAEVKWFKIKFMDKVSEEKVKTEKGFKVSRDIKIELISDDREDLILGSLKQIEKREGSMISIDTEIDKIETNNIAFDHIKVISYALERLRNKLEYTPIAFNLLGECFTITELQKVYETILGKSLLTPNFRRKISPMLQETEMMKTEFQHRPAKVYRYNIEWNNEF